MKLFASPKWALSATAGNFSLLQVTIYGVYTIYSSLHIYKKLSKCCFLEKNILVISHC